jgi:hypothetical protein
MNENPREDRPASETPAPLSPPAPRLPHAFPYIPIRVVDARSPWPTISTIFLNSVPRRGDGITLTLGSRSAGYTIDFVNFDPKEPIQVTLGCLPSQSVTAGQIEPAKINDFIQTNEQAFQKAESYSKTMIGLGYVGLFAIWSFVQAHLSHRAILTTALLAGFSLLIYIAWEVIQMFHRSMLQLRFNRALMDDPANHARAINNFVEQTRTRMSRDGRIWIVVLFLTVVPGFSAALILIYNIFAGLTGLWPFP